LRNALNKDSNKLIFLLLDDLTDEEMNTCPELKQYLKQCAFVRWGSPGFLNKLRFFLPEPAFLTFQRNVTLRTLQPPASLLKSSPSLMQVDAVSGVWTYTLQNSPIGSVSTQSTNDRIRQQQQQNGYIPYAGSSPAAGGYLASTGLGVRPAPSVISSVYSHHTYQSIPEHQQQQHLQNLPESSSLFQNQHIYHTLEPSMIPPPSSIGGIMVKPLRLSGAGGRVPQNDEQVNAVYINRNLDLVMKSDSGGEEEDENQINADKEVDVKTDISSPSISPASSSSSSGRGSDVESSCHHTHSQSGISAQQLIPASKKMTQEDEYVV
jgi:hypothetical protein